MEASESASMADTARREKERGEEEEGKKEDNAGTHDFDRTAGMQSVSATRSKSNGGDITRRYALS